MKPLRRITRSRIFRPNIECYRPRTILLFLPNRNELSVTERFLVFFLRLPLRRAVCESEIGAASHRSECRFPDEIKTCFRPFCPDLLAVHRAGPEDNRIIGKEMQEMRRAFRAPVRLDRNFLLPPRPSYGRRYPAAPYQLQRRLLSTKGKLGRARTNEKRFAFDKFWSTWDGLGNAFTCSLVRKSL